MSFPEWLFSVWLFVMGLLFMAHCTDRIVKAIKERRT